MILITVFAIMIMLTYMTFTSVEKIVDKLGSGLIIVIGKIMGLILAIMGTGMAT